MRTEVGFIPEDWRVATLGELCNFENGDRGVNYPSGSDFVLSGVPFVNAGHLKRGRIAFDKLDFITRSKFETLGNGKFQPGDVLFCLRGSLGKFAVVGDDTPEGAVASSLIIIRPRPKSLALQFLVAYLDSKICGDMIELWAGGAAQPNLGGRELARFLVPVPPTVEEQLSIATALADADALLAELEGMIAKKRDLKQAALQHLLTGKTRLPGFSGEWGVKRLETICSMKSGEQITTESIDDHSAFRCFGGNGLRGYAARFTHDGRFALIGRQGALCGNVLEVSGQFFASEHALVVTPHANTDISWLSVILKRMNLNQYSESSAQPGLSVKKLLVLEVIAPSTKAEQTAIAEVLSDMDADLAALEAQAAKARAVKQGMMQELLTGRVRLV